MDKIKSDTSRRGFLKTLAVGAGGYALGSVLIQPKEAMGESLQENLGKVPMGTRWAISSGGLVNYQLSNFKSLLDKVGRKKFIETVEKKSAFLGARSAGLAKKLGFTGNDAKSFAAMSTAMVTVYYGPKQEYAIEVFSAEKVTVRCLNCLFWNAAQARKITEDLCSTNSQFWWGGFAQAINPKLTSTLVKARPLGDSVCEWTIELKA